MSQERTTALSSQLVSIIAIITLAGLEFRVQVFRVQGFRVWRFKGLGFNVGALAIRMGLWGFLIMNIVSCG